MKYVIYSLLCISGLCVAQNHYYAILYSYEDKFHSMRQAHSFASFLQYESDSQSWSNETISWLPASGEVMPFLPYAVKGRNYTLKETLELTNPHQHSLRHWGPVEITQNLYQVAIDRSRYLKQQLTEYKAIDNETRAAPSQNLPGGAVNCIHAISDIFGFIDTGTRYGHSASAYLFEKLKPYIIGQKFQSFLYWQNPWNH